MKDKLYICHTPYQVFITLIKNYNEKSNNDIVICNTIPNSDILINNLKKKKLFKNVYSYDEVNIKEKLNLLKIEKVIFRKKQMINLFENNCSINVKDYKDIYIYNDWTSFGAYLMDKKIYYHLIEDGLDGFYYMKENFKDKVTFLTPNVLYKIKNKIKKILHIGYDFFGQSKYVLDIEVNNAKIIPEVIKEKNIQVVTKQSLYDSINAKQKDEIYSIFADEELTFNKNKKTLLLLTQPLYKDNMVESLDIQKKVYQSIIEQYQDTYDIIIKPHPRDDYNYKLLKKNIQIISRFMPIEIINFNNHISFDLAITIMSSSINSLNRVSEKKQLGLDYLKKFKNA